jgi:hypothetical protein
MTAGTRGRHCGVRAVTAVRDPPGEPCADCAMGERAIVSGSTGDSVNGGRVNDVVGYWLEQYRSGASLSPDMMAILKI